MTDEFQALIDKHRQHMAELSAIFQRDGCLHAASLRDPSYSILLTRNSSPHSELRVTSFRDREPVGHREYDRLEGGSPIQNALQEFAGDGWRVVRQRGMGLGRLFKCDQARGVAC